MCVVMGASPSSPVFFFNFVVVGAATLGPVFLFQFCGVAQVMIIHKNI